MNSPKRFSMRSFGGWARALVAAAASMFLTWIERPTVGLVVVCASIYVCVVCASCQRVVLVNPNESVIRVGPDCSCRVYLLVDGGWRLSDGKMEIDEGFYVVNPSFVEQEGK